MKVITFIAILLSLALGLFAQNINVQSFRVLENDMDARVNFPKRDQNGEVCAIIKVVTTQTGFSFDVGSLGVVATEQRAGEVWVYVPRGVQRITIGHPQLGVLRNYAFGIPIQSAMVYELVLVTARVEVVVMETEIETQWLAIASEPKGANVFIEERLVGTTPYTGQFPGGVYSYRVELPRYHPEAGRVTLVGGKSEAQTLSFNLRPRYGSISITSTPESGMTIFLNDENTGKTTPAILEGIISGNHTIRLIDQWYQPQAKSVTVTDNQTSYVSFTMEPAFANISITASPAADIFIDNTKRGSGNFSARMLTGIYTLKAELDKHNPVQRQLVVEAGKPQNITLELKPKTGRLDVTSAPFGAKIQLNGKDYGTTPTTIRDLLIGNYTLTLEKPGHGTLTKAITIAEGKTTEVTETLPSGMEVTITSTPSVAQLWIGGVSVGTTPYKTTLAYGSHSVKLVNGKMEVNETITVTQGSKTHWEYDVNETSGNYSDPRDGKTYKWVKIGEQVWMVENLAYKTNNGNFWAYDNNINNVAKCGYLYDWQTAIFVCPTGWHLPSDAEWTQLTDFVGSNSGIKLKAKNGWSRNGNGTDDFGFSALPGGFRGTIGEFFYFGNSGYWWSSTGDSAITAWRRDMGYGDSDVRREDAIKGWGFSVRCIKD